MTIRRSAGFTYLGVLVLVAIMGVLLAVAGESWNAASMREKELELLFVGGEYRKAIRAFAENAPVGAHRYPGDLAELLKDPRRPDTQRYLRRLYPDPVTGKAEWGLIRASDGGIAGVHSLSEERPLKQAGFRATEAAFEGRARYADWEFAYSAGQSR